MRCRVALVAILGTVSSSSLLRQLVVLLVPIGLAAFVSLFAIVVHLVVRTGVLFILLILGGGWFVAMAPVVPHMGFGFFRMSGTCKCKEHFGLWVVETSPTA